MKLTSSISTILVVVYAGVAVYAVSEGNRLAAAGFALAACTEYFNQALFVRLKHSAYVNHVLRIFHEAHKGKLPTDADPEIMNYIKHLLQKGV